MKIGKLIVVRSGWILAAYYQRFSHQNLYLAFNPHQLTYWGCKLTRGAYCRQIGFGPILLGIVDLTRIDWTATNGR